ncbi:hypothetical protein HDV05_007275 [Chytridiales sp. JEL 0842]|nr:hypothetical protein HDV05_007275 [Chytridiales sp. JEL 0842]
MKLTAPVELTDTNPRVKSPALIDSIGHTVILLTQAKPVAYRCSKDWIRVLHSYAMPATEKGQDETLSVVSVKLVEGRAGVALCILNTSSLVLWDYFENNLLAQIEYPKAFHPPRCLVARAITPLNENREDKQIPYQIGRKPFGVVGMFERADLVELAAMKPGTVDIIKIVDPTR